MTDNGPRLIGRKVAAAYCSITPTAFSLWVSTHKMPPPIPGTRKWDKKAIDAKLDEISGLAVNENEDPYEKWMRENQDKSEIYPTMDSLREWRLKKEKRREKYRPKLGLDAKLERVILFMADHPECTRIEEIPWAGPTFMRRLVQVGAVKWEAGDRYSLTREGYDETVRIRKWRALAPD